MTPANLTRALDELGMSTNYFAEMLGVDSRSVYRWRSGEHEIPPMVASIVGLLLNSNRIRVTPRMFFKARHGHGPIGEK